LATANSIDDTYFLVFTGTTSAGNGSDLDVGSRGTANQDHIGVQMVDERTKIPDGLSLMSDGMSQNLYFFFMYVETGDEFEVRQNRGGTESIVHGVQLRISHFSRKDDFDETHMTGTCSFFLKPLLAQRTI
jgi:hypothetical protein